MNQVVVLLIALATIGWVTYPLLKGMSEGEPVEEKRTGRARKARPRKKRRRRCPNCGNFVSPEDVYCSRCGTKL